MNTCGECGFWFKENEENKTGMCNHDASDNFNMELSAEHDSCEFFEE